MCLHGRKLIAKSGQEHLGKPRELENKTSNTSLIDELFTVKKSSFLQTAALSILDAERSLFMQCFTNFFGQFRRYFGKSIVENYQRTCFILFSLSFYSLFARALAASAFFVLRFIFN